MFLTICLICIAINIVLLTICHIIFKSNRFKDKVKDCFDTICGFSMLSMFILIVILTGKSCTQYVNNSKVIVEEQYYDIYNIAKDNKNRLILYVDNDDKTKFIVSVKDDIIEFGGNDVVLLEKDKNNCYHLDKIVLSTETARSLGYIVKEDN